MKRKPVNEGALVAALVAVLLLSSVTSVACVGFGRNRDDEFEARMQARQRDDYYESRYSDEKWDTPSGAEVRETLVEHRPRPVVDPGARRNYDDGPLAWLHRLHQELRERPVRGYALIWEDARVYRTVRLDEDSALGRLGYRPEHWRASGGQVLPVRVVGVHGQALEIETISSEEARRHCAGGVRRPLDGYQVRLFVPRTELVPVVISEIRQQYEDGSAALVPPGVAVRPTEHGLFIRLAGGSIEVPAPAGLEHIGLSYEEAGFPVERLGDPLLKGYLEPSDSLRLAGEIVELRMLSGDAGRARWVRAGDDGGSKIYMADRCVGLTVVTSDPSPMRTETLDGLLLHGLSPVDSLAGHRYEVRQGALAWWSSGERAGYTRSIVRHSQEPDEIGGLLCFPLMGVVQVCHEPADVTAIDETELLGVTGDVEEGEIVEDGDESQLIQKGRGVWLIE